MKKLGVIAAVLMLASCSEKVPVTKETVKLSEIYFRFAVEVAAGSPRQARSIITSSALKAGIQCVHKEIVGKKAGIYGRETLQSLILEHIFPEDLSSYSNFTDGRRVQASMERRMKDLGFKSVAEATRSTNLIAKALVREYAYYAEFVKAHDIKGGIKSSNLVLQECAPKGLNLK